MNPSTQRTAGSDPELYGPGEPGRMSIGTGSSSEASADQLLQLLKKRGWLVLLIAAIGLICGLVYYLMQPKKYTAVSKIEVTQDVSSEFRVEAASAVAPGMSTDSQEIETQIQILMSDTLALETIRALHLDSNNDFAKTRAGYHWDLSKPGDRATLIGTFLGDLSVTRVGHTSIVQVSVTTLRPELSALIANTLVDKYIDHTFKDSYASTQQVATWLNGQLGDLKQNLEKSQQRLLDLQQQIGLIGGLGSVSQSDSILVANLTELNRELADAQVERMVKEATVNSIKSSPPSVIDAQSQGNRSIVNSQTNLAELQNEYQSLSQVYGPEYYRVKQLKAQIDQAQSALAGGEQAQVDLAQKQLDAARNNESMLRKALNDEEQSAYKNGSKAIQYELALQEYQANRALLDGLQVRLQEAGIMAGLRSSSVHIVSDADIPVIPSAPKKMALLGIGLGAGLVIGVLLAFLLEAMDTNLRTIGEIEEALQLPLLAAIPQVGGENLRPAEFYKNASAGNTGSWSKIGEALRSLRTSILLSRPGAAPQVIMFTSTRPAEGKTSITILESIIFALSGAKVLLIDADLRRPTVHLRLMGNAGENKGIGLSNVLTGKATLDEAVQVWPDQPNLHVMLSGPVPPLPSELIGSKQMVSLLEEARKKYDVIFLDTPPVMAVTDASVMGHLADAAILVVRYGDAGRRIVTRSLELLERAGADMLGVVINMVDFRAAGYSEYYGKKYYEYYGERTE